MTSPGRGPVALQGEVRSEREPIALNRTGAPFRVNESSVKNRGLSDFLIDQTGRNV
jgi:hypothetical protein